MRPTGADRRRAILYCHGAAIPSGNLGYSVFGLRLANVTGWQVLSFDAASPRTPYPAAVEDAVRPGTT